MTPQHLTQSLKAEAARLGFDLTGCCAAVTPTGFPHLVSWLEEGYAGEMEYLQSRLHAYEHPRHVMDGVQSVLMLGMNYQTQRRTSSKTGTGRIASYAWGTNDYHDLIHDRLKQLKRFAIALGKDLEQPLLARGVVDTAPLLEREFAQLSGLGWAAKNTMLINPRQGSWFFLAALLVNQPMEYDAPFETSHCGTCTACLDACPTHAFTQPGKLDATRCISYLTIEHRSAIPRELRPQMQDWILGCDVCQAVCPWNNKALLSNEPAFEPIDDHNPLDLRSLFWLDDEQFRARFRKTPLWRPRRRGILRNAAIALGNQPHEDNLPALEKGVNDSEPMVRGASAWAMGKHRFAKAKETIQRRMTEEIDANVREELQWSLDQHAI